MKPSQVGDVIDRRYRLERLIAEGGAGLVFAASQIVSGRAVALKLPRAQWLGNAQVTQRLLREARALTLARHPHVVELLDAGLTTDEAPYLALELLEGRTLHGLIAARQRLTVPETVALGCQLCDAIGACHASGVVHRDVKPANLFVALDGDRRERLKLLDFGVALFVGQAATGGSDERLSLQGAVLGTAEYMAPEQLLGASDIDARCDIYGAGVALYECLTGAVPFEGTYGQILLQATTRPAPPLSQRCPVAPDELGDVLSRALARDRDDRYPSAAALKSALCEALGQPVPTLAPLAHSVHPASSLPVSRPSVTIPVSEAHPSAQNEQRRRFPRVPYATPVTIRRSGGSAFYGRSEDVSEGGILVLTAQLCDQGERVHVRFALPGSGQFLEVAADARWVRAGRKLGVAGFEFVDLPEAQRLTLRQYVQKQQG